MERRRKQEYRCEATSVAGFIQPVAVAYLARGYWFYVAGRIPEQKDPRAVDRKLIAKYRVDTPRWERVRRKKVGLANLQYIRHERFFLLLATHGQHRFFEDEAGQIRDAQRVPIKYAGYSLSYRNGHASVRIDRETCQRLEVYLAALAPQQCVEDMIEEFRLAQFEPYAPVRRQLLSLLRAVHRARKRAGSEPIPMDCLRLKRRIYRPFAYEEFRGAA